MTGLPGNDTIQHAVKRRSTQAWQTARPFVKLIGVALFLWILSRLDLREILHHARNASIPLFIASFAMAILNYAAKSLRWSVLQQSAGLKKSLYESWKIYTIGIFLGNITPGKFGEFGRVGYLRRDGLHAGTGVTLVILDRLFDLLVIVVLSIASMLILFGERWFLITLAAGVMAGVLSAIGLSAMRGFLARFSWLHYVKIIRKPRTALSLLALTLIGWLFYFAWALLLAQSLGIVIAPVVLIAAFTITGVLSLLPIAPAGLGTREAALLTLLAPYGLDPEKTVALSLLMFVSILMSSLVGGYYWLRMK